MGHPQSQTPIQTGNSTAEGIMNNKVQPKQTKAMDMLSTGYVIAKLKADSEFIGGWEKQT
jgi:hypothetical protein